MKSFNAAEIIERFDSINENEVDADIKLEWIQSLEMMIYEEIISKHEDDPILTMIEIAKELVVLDEEEEEEKPIESVEDYFDRFDMYTPLLVPLPYHEVYIAWLSKKVAETYKETNKFNASVNLFNSAYYTFMDAYNRKHLPLQTYPKINMRTL